MKLNISPAAAAAAFLAALGARTSLGTIKQLKRKVITLARRRLRIGFVAGAILMLGDSEHSRHRLHFTTPPALTPHAMSTRRRCCPTAWCWLQEDLIAVAMFPRARNCTIRRAGPGLHRQPQHRHARSTRRPCYPSGTVLVAGEFNGSQPLRSAELYDPRRDLDCHRQLRPLPSLSAHGDLAAQRHGASLPGDLMALATPVSGFENCTIRRAGPGISSLPRIAGPTCWPSPKAVRAWRGRKRPQIAELRTYSRSRSPDRTSSNPKRGRANAIRSPGNEHHAAGSKVACADSEGRAKLPVAVQVPVAGSYSSALLEVGCH